MSGYFRYLTGRGNVSFGMHLVGEISVEYLSGRESVSRGNARRVFV